MEWGQGEEILDFGFWILDFGFWILDFGSGIGDRGSVWSIQWPNRSEGGANPFHRMFLVA
jgi:hypothetical protein